MPPKKRTLAVSKSSDKIVKNSGRKPSKRVKKEKESDEQSEGDEPESAGSENPGDSKDFDASDDFDPSISHYERIRLENIKRNEEFLSDLGVSSIRTSLKPKVTKKATTRRSSGIVKVPQAPTRRSSRVTVEKLASEIKQLEKEGKTKEATEKQTELDAMIAKQNEGAYVVEPAYMAVEEPRTRKTDPIPLTELEFLSDEESGEKIAKELVQSLKESTDKKKSKAGSKQSSDQPVASSSSSPFSKLKLVEEDVVKLTPSRMTAVALSPSSQSIIAVAGDKNGFLGLWNATRTNGENLIYKYRPHISNIIKFHFSNEDIEKLFSVSYDGTIRKMDLQQEAFINAFEAPESLSETYFSDGSFLYDKPHCAIVSKSSGFASLIDFRASSSVYQWNHEMQEARLTSIQQHPTDPNLIITAGSKNGGIAIHDIRSASKKWKPLSFLNEHSKSINAAYVSPDGNYLVSISLDDTIRTWKNFTRESSVVSHVYRHNNWTGRWLSTFRPSFDPKRPNTFVCGSLLQPRRMELFSVQDTEKIKLNLNLFYNLDSEWLASVNSRNCFHPTLEMVLGSNSSGKVHLFR
jgi:WD40 repeat protein